MRPWFAQSLGEFCRQTPAQIAASLAYEQAARFGTLELKQRDSWETSAALLQDALAEGDDAWHIFMECDLLRLEKRADAILLTDRAIFMLEFKMGTQKPDLNDLRQTDNYAMDLHDFHAGSRGVPIIPILIAPSMPRREIAPPLFWHGVVPVMVANAAMLPDIILRAQAALPQPATAIDANAWAHSAYRPVPSVLEAARLLYRRNAVPDIGATRADAHNLTRTTDAIARVISKAQTEGGRYVVFVTGIPGAGKTLCGLNLVFGALRESGAAFLSGNVPLVTVLREALARDAAPQGGAAFQAAERAARTALQNVHRFLEHHVIHAHEMPEARIIVFDEAQRAWDQAQATRDGQRRKSHLSLSEPAHTLEIMARHDGWAVIVALIGNGQEINTGEAGLAEWGRVIAAAPSWRAVAARRSTTADDPAQRLAEGAAPWLALDDDLDLQTPIRSLRSSRGTEWVEAVLRGDARSARAIAEETPELPYYITRDAKAWRATLRARTRGLRRAGLVASAGARRLRAEGLGVQVPDIADWFLKRWPDIRSSEALETFATEYDCQGLELDVVGLAWGGDFLRHAGQWRARRFVGHHWQIVRGVEEQRYILNTYRVLLTRARYETIIWVPPGSAIDDPFHDITRPSAEMDALADFLHASGARSLEALTQQPQPAPVLAQLL
ncbi:MAG: DNA/RNA helicase domain-containing protein [Alphaproteobacteria bacterium]